jgi:2-methylisocitrate lyase-like PEP mutase family enzyme
MGGYTGMEDTGVISIPESVMIGGWIARVVSFPVILDGDTGHGGIMSVRRLVEDSIHAGLAGIRIDDQAIEAKRGTTSKGIQLAPLDVTVARYKAAVDLKNELSPSFVIMANCYAGEAVACSFEAAVGRMKAYQEVAGVDWVVFTAARSLEQLRAAREAVHGPFTSFATFGLSDQELLDIGINTRWGGATLNVPYAALYAYVRDYLERGPVATAEWREKNKDNPFATGAGFRDGGAQERLRDRLEDAYFSQEMEDLIERYKL